jgi:4a-hydroxytetrahydrobiopterin dehydratase
VKIFKGQELLDAVMEAPGWSVESGELVRTETFKDFAGAMEFVKRVAEMAEAAGHHPDIDIRYNKVRLALVSHDAGGITEKDLALAREIAAAAVQTE